MTTSEQSPDASAVRGDLPPRALPPLWAVELLDVLGRRGGFALTVAAVMSALALIFSLALPAVVPPQALVGLLVAVTALAVGLALTLALDALDVRIRGPRHVRSSGGELVALLPANPSVTEARDLADAVRAVHVPGATLHLGIAPVGEDVTSSSGWTRALAEALAATGSSVLLIDLTTGPTSVPGILEVVRDRRPLSEVVTYAEGHSLAEVGPGADALQALQALITLPTLLPDDVDVMLVALPHIVTRSAVNASRVLDQVLFVAEANLTSRVELMASLDALRVAGCGPQVVLIDEGTYVALRPGAEPPHADMQSARIAPVPLQGASAGTARAAVTDGPPVQPEPWAQGEESAELVEHRVLDEDPDSDPPPPTEPEDPSGAPFERGAEGVGDPNGAMVDVRDDEASSPLRTVDVLEAAARERAETTIEAALADTVPMDKSELEAQRVAGAPHAKPDAPAAAVSAPAASPEAPALLPESAPTDDRSDAQLPATERPAEDERTTELRVDTGPLPDWASVEDEEDLLRTTVQMSVFSEELELRDED